MCRSLFHLAGVIVAIAVITAGQPRAYAIDALGNGQDGFDMVLLPTAPGEVGQRLAVSWRGRDPAQLELRIIDVFGESHPIDPRRIEPGMHLLPLDLHLPADQVVGVMVDERGQQITARRVARPPEIGGPNMPNPALPHRPDGYEKAAGRPSLTPEGEVIDWKPTFTENSAPDGEVLAATVYDDGTGPTLVIGGTFLNAGGQRVNRIARWNGVSWSTLGAGLAGNHLARVVDLVVYDGDLIAAGFFSSAGGVAANNVARWNGSEWSALGTGLNDWVRTIALHDGGLVAAGFFTAAGATPASRVAFWNGTEWSPLGAGMNDAVLALASHEGSLVAGGRFTSSGATPISRIARWDGQQWVGFGNGVAGTVRALLSHDGALLAGGTNLGGSGTHPVMRWNGKSWGQLGSVGIETYGFALHDGSPLASAVRAIFRWDGTNWIPIASRIAGAAYAITRFDNALIVAGKFSGFEGLEAASLARFSGGQWGPFASGAASRTTAMVHYDGHLVKASWLYIDPTAPEVIVTRLFRWTNGQWESFAGTIHGYVWTLAVHEGDLIIGGQLTRAGSVSVRNIAGWNGNTWRALGTEIDGPVWALASHGGELVAGGSFQNMWLSPAMVGVARWDGMQWRSMGPPVNWSVNALHLHDGQLLAGASVPGGDFGQGRVAIWNGSAWMAVGSDVPIEVRAVTVHDGQYVVTGGRSGQGGPPAYRWDGAQWTPMGPGGLQIAPGNAIRSFGGSLYVGGHFGLLRWDGTNWHQPYPGTGVQRLYTFGHDLVVLGDLAGFPALPSVDAIAFGPSQRTTTSTQATSPSPEGEWVTIRAEVVGLSAPTRGHVTIVGTPGGSCTDLALEAIDATRSVAECAIRWNRPGTKRVRAHYVGGSDSVVTWQPSTSAEYEIVITPERLLNDGFETAGGTNAVAASVH